ncbi:MAG: hypothetical protein U0228_28685 [Myxococcaceae bacterium]
MSRVVALFGSLLLLSGCPGPSPVECRVGADCASGMCRGDGTCAPVVTDGGTGGGTTGGGSATGGGGGSTGGGSATGGGGGTTGGGCATGGGGTTGGGGGMMGCLPNHDGRIDRGEVFFQPGLRATFKISGATTYDTRGDGGTWDFTGALAGDASRLVETKALTGEWYEADFPDGGYTTELGQGSDLRGVFSASADALYLQGVVSTTDGVTSTRLRYEPWVKVLAFPLALNDTWETNATVTGRYQGAVIGFTLPFQSERYQMTVDRTGTAATPFAGFDVLRVRTVMTRSLNTVPSIVIRSFNWNTECFGTVATVSSQNNETSTEFTDVTEVRRLSP